MQTIYKTSILGYKNPCQCFYCEREFNTAHYGTNKPLAKTRDHIIPLSSGGKNCGVNIVFACVECNSLKGDLSLEDFINIVQSLIDKNKGYKTIPETRLYLIVKKSGLLVKYVNEKGQNLCKTTPCGFLMYI